MEKSKEPISRYQTAADKGAEWLLTQQRPDGSIEPVGLSINSYYKVPLALYSAGHPEEAHRILDYAKSGDFTPAGDFRSSLRGKFHLDFYTYANCWLIMAAQRLGRFDIARPAFNFVLSFQDPAGGGFCSASPYPEGRSRQDILSTSFSGLAALSMGRPDVAEKAGGFLKRLAEAQPDPEHALYCATAGDASREALLREEKNTVFKGKPEQRFYFPGIAAAFLSELFRTTGHQPYRETAVWYLDFWQACGPYAFRSTRSGKAGLGAAFLYQATGEERFLRIAFQVADYLVEIQQPDGRWFGKKGGDPDPSYTAEFVVWLNEIVSVS